VRLAVALLASLAGVVAQAAGPPRIVSLAPHLTEIAYAAGAGHALVGVVEYSDFPQAARALPRVGDAWRVDVERVLSLRPDIVLAWASGTPAGTIERLESLGLHVVTVPTFRLADVPQALRLVGELAGTQSTAGSAADRFAAGVHRLREHHAGARVLSVFVQIDDEPLFTVNDRHVISEIVGLCGGRNVFGGLAAIAPQVDVEAVLARDPQVILDADDTVADPGARWQRWQHLAAVRAGTIYSVPSDTLARATPRLVEGMAAVCAALDDARRRIGPDPAR
jgi:iron complex transport system substrate-binding protein